MATFYKYKSREGEDQVDWRGITKGISDDLSRIQGEREQKRVDIDNAVLTTLETIADKPLGTDAARNEITSDYAAQASAIALENQRLLKTGQMSLKQYNSVTNTAGSSTKKLFNLTRQYQENYQRHMDALKPDKDGLIQGSGLGALLRKQAEALGDPTNTKYYMDPQSGSAYIARVLRDGETAKEGANFRLIDGEAYSLMDVSTAQNIITMDVNRYQAEQVADRIAKAAGIVTEVVMKEDVKTRTDSFNRIFQQDADGVIVRDKDDNKVLSEIGEAVTSQIRASFASPMDYASMLYDTLNKPSIAKNDDDDGYTNLLTGKVYEGDVKDAIIFITENSQQVPKLTDAQEKQAQEGVLDIIRSKMGITETVYDQRAEDRKDQELNLRKRQVKDQETLARERLKFRKDEKKKGQAGEKSIATNMTKLFFGTEEQADAAANFIRGLPGNSNLRIQLDGDRMILRRTLEDGSVSEDIVSKAGGIANFIESSATLMNTGITGIDEALTLSGATKDADGNYLPPSLIKINSASTITPRVSITDQIISVINKDINSIAITEDQATDEETLRDLISPLANKYGVTVSEQAIGDEIVLSLPGSDDDLVIPLNKATPTSIKEALKGFIAGDINEKTFVKYKSYLRPNSSDDESVDPKTEINTGKY